MTDLSVYDNDPTLYLFTSLTAGSSHIVTATSRIETILKANKIPFQGVDTATNELARKLFQRRASGKKLPLLVREGFVLGDLEEIEEWNEYDELKEALGVSSTPAVSKPTPPIASSWRVDASTPAAKKEDEPQATSEQNLAIRQLGAEAAKAASAKKAIPGNISTTNPLLAEKVNSPAATTPKKGTSPSGILSPRSIPLPATPGVPQASSKTPLASPSSGGSGERKSFHGADVEDATSEEIKKVEQEEAIAEVTSSDEEDSEDEEVAAKAKPVEGAKTATPTASATATAKVAEEEESDEDDEDEDEDEESSEEEEQPAALDPKSKTPAAIATTKIAGKE